MRGQRDLRVVLPRNERAEPTRRLCLRLRSGADARRNEYTGRNEISNEHENEHERTRKRANESKKEREIERE